MEEKDLFDRIFSLPFLRKGYPVYKKNKEVLLYLFFGGLTFLVSVFSFAFFIQFWHWEALMANLLSWILAVLFAFWTNRIWVFQSPTPTFNAFILQLVSFFEGRIATLIIEEGLLWLFITLLHYNDLIVKVFAQLVVIILNYIFSKKWIFKKQTP